MRLVYTYFIQRIHCPSVIRFAERETVHSQNDIILIVLDGFSWITHSLSDSIKNTITDRSSLFSNTISRFLQITLGGYLCYYKPYKINTKHISFLATGEVLCPPLAELFSCRLVSKQFVARNFSRYTPVLLHISRCMD